MVDKIQLETTEAHAEINRIRQETAEFLNGNWQTHDRNHRAAPVVALTALAGIGLFGAGIAMGN